MCERAETNVANLAQKEYKTKHDLVGKVIPWELCKKLKFEFTNKWYKHIPESVLENKTHKLPWDFEIQNGSLNLGQMTRSYKNQQKKRKCRIVDVIVPADHRERLKECERRISTSILQGNWKRRETWKRRWYQLSLVLLVQSAKGLV